MTPSGVPKNEDRSSAVGLGEPEVFYHVDGKEVTKEEWLQLCKDWENQSKQMQEKAEENMNNERDPKDHE